MIVANSKIGQLTDYKGKLLPLMDSLESQGKWKKITVETGLPYYLNEKAGVWKYLVLERSSN